MGVFVSVCILIFFLEFLPFCRRVGNKVKNRQGGIGVQMTDDFKWIVTRDYNVKTVMPEHCT